MCQLAGGEMAAPNHPAVYVVQQSGFVVVVNKPRQPGLAVDCKFCVST